MAVSFEKSLILGAEYDPALRQALKDVLASLGAQGLAHDWSVGGAQELETMEVVIGADRIAIEAETFVGLSIRGPARVIERIHGMVIAAMRQT